MFKVKASFSHRLSSLLGKIVILAACHIMLFPPIASAAPQAKEAKSWDSDGDRPDLPGCLRHFKTTEQCKEGDLRNLNSASFERCDLGQDTNEISEFYVENTEGKEIVKECGTVKLSKWFKKTCVDFCKDTGKTGGKCVVAPKECEEKEGRFVDSSYCQCDPITEQFELDADGDAPETRSCRGSYSAKDCPKNKLVPDSIAIDQCAGANFLDERRVDKLPGDASEICPANMCCAETDDYSVDCNQYCKDKAKGTDDSRVYGCCLTKEAECPLDEKKYMLGACHCDETDCATDPQVVREAFGSLLH